MATGTGELVVVGWAVERAERQRLLGLFPAAYPDVVADHVTLKAGVPKEVELPAPAEGEIVGQVDDGAGVQALIVRIGGTTDRPGGGTYHLTWSLDRAAGRRGVHSNDVIAERGWTPLEQPVSVALKPARFPF